MKCCYKITDADGNVVGIEGIYDTEMKDYTDTDSGFSYVAVEKAEYYSLSEFLSEEVF